VGTKFIQTSWPCEDGLTRCTDDGYSAELNIILEVKAMGKEAHEAARRHEIPKHYMQQVQWNLMRTKASHALFVSARPEDDDPLAVVQVSHDLVMQEGLLAAARSFKALIETEQPPELVDGDYVKVSDPDLEAFMQDYAELSAKADELKEQITSRMGDLPGIVGGGLKVTRYTRAGSVQYKKIPELQGVDLEKYRAAPVAAVRFTVAK
jgi:hypothetical protein